MPTALEELDGLIQLLEAQIPANPNSTKNLKLRARLERSMVRYFRALEDAFPYGEVARLYNRYVEKE